MRTWREKQDFYRRIKDRKQRALAIKAKKQADLEAIQSLKADYVPQGALRRLFDPAARQYDEILISGSAGTGKSRAGLEYLHWHAVNYPGCRLLLVRKTRTSLTESGLVTLERHVLGEENPIVQGPQRSHRTVYRYPNGSVIVVGGMDKSSRIMSTEFDIIFVQEAIELEEDDWESLTTRLRNYVVPYQQIVADTNPSFPTHWLKRRCDAKKTVLINSSHEDNPRLYNEAKGEWTREGEEYLARLGNLTGARLQRLRWGRWVQAEGVVYEEWNESVHLIDPFGIPKDWKRIRVIDFGLVHPFVCQWWAFDHDQRMYLYREIYMTDRTVSTHAKQIRELDRHERITATICDHDAEDRRTLLENGIPNFPAKKDVLAGIGKVQDRLKVQADGRPRLFIFRDSLVEVDRELEKDKKPLSTAQEFDGYLWKDNDKKEEPVKENDHGLDALRYAVMYADGNKGWARGAAA